MIDLLFEGFRSTALPCTAALVVPGLVALLASRRSAAWALLGYVVVTGVGAWARFAGFGPAELTGVAVLGGAIFVLAGTLLSWTRETADEPWRGALGGALIGLTAAWSWQPCVGQQLGNVLTDLGARPAANLVPMVVYIAGTSLMLVVLAALPIAVPALDRIRDHRATRHVGLGLGICLTLLLAVGVYDDLVDQLLRISTW